MFICKMLHCNAKLIKKYESRFSSILERFKREESALFYKNHPDEQPCYMRERLTRAGHEAKKRSAFGEGEDAGYGFTTISFNKAGWELRLTYLLMYDPQPTGSLIGICKSPVMQNQTVEQLVKEMNSFAKDDPRAIRCGRHIRYLAVAAMVEQNVDRIRVLFNEIREVVAEACCLVDETGRSKDTDFAPTICNARFHEDRAAYFALEELEDVIRKEKQRYLTYGDVVSAEEFNRHKPKPD